MVQPLAGTGSVHHSVSSVSLRPTMRSDGAPASRPPQNGNSSMKSFETQGQSLCYTFTIHSKASKVCSILILVKRMIFISALTSVLLNCIYSSRALLQYTPNPRGKPSPKRHPRTFSVNVAFGKMWLLTLWSCHDDVLLIHHPAYRSRTWPFWPAVIDNSASWKHLGIMAPPATEMKIASVRNCSFNPRALAQPTRSDSDWDLSCQGSNKILSDWGPLVMSDLKL